MTETLLLDEFLPAYDHVVSVSQVFRAPPWEVFEAAVTMDLYRLPVARVLIAARGLPTWIADARARRRGKTVTPKQRGGFAERDLRAGPGDHLSQPGDSNVPATPSCSSRGAKPRSHSEQ